MKLDNTFTQQELNFPKQEVYTDFENRSSPLDEINQYVNMFSNDADLGKAIRKYMTLSSKKQNY